MTEKEEAYICLNCMKPKCTNCLGKSVHIKQNPNWEQIGRMLCEGMSVTEISHKTGIAHQTIHAFIKSHNMKPEGAKRFKREELKALLISGFNRRTIGEKFNIPDQTVYYWICKYGLNEYQTGKKKVKNVLQETEVHGS